MTSNSGEAFRAWDSRHGSDVYDPSTQWRVGKKVAGRELDDRTWDEFPVAPRGCPAPAVVAR